MIPAMWVTVTSPGTELDAAERGIGALGVAPASYQEQERRTLEYHQRIELCEPVGGLVDNQVATLNFLYCHEDVKHAAARDMAMLGTFGLLNSHLLFTREAYPTRAQELLANLAPGARKKGDSPGDPTGIPEGVCVGDPARISKAVKEWESIGVDMVDFLLNASEILEHDEVIASLELFAREVMPGFAKVKRASPSPCRAFTSSVDRM